MKRQVSVYICDGPNTYKVTQEIPEYVDLAKELMMFALALSQGRPLATLATLGVQSVQISGTIKADGWICGCGERLRAEEKSCWKCGFKP